MEFWRASKMMQFQGLKESSLTPHSQVPCPLALQLSGKRLKVAQLENQNANDRSILFSLKREREVTKSRKARVTRDLMEEGEWTSWKPRGPGSKPHHPSGLLSLAGVSHVASGEPLVSTLPLRQTKPAEIKGLCAEGARPELWVMHGSNQMGRKTKLFSWGCDDPLTHTKLALWVVKSDLWPLSGPMMLCSSQHLLWQILTDGGREKSCWPDNSNDNSSNNWLYLLSTYYSQDPWWVLYITLQLIFMG